MVVLEVGIDAQGAVRGAQQASSALANITNAARFALTELGGLNSNMGRLGTVLSAAQPWLVAISTALSGVSLALGLMSNKASTATNEWRTLTETIQNADARLKAAGILGVSDSFYADERMQNARKLLEYSLTADAAKQPLGYRRAAFLAGMSGDEVLTLLKERPELRNFALEESQAGVGNLLRNMTGFGAGGEIGPYVAPAGAQELFRYSYQRYSRQVGADRERNNFDATGLYQFGADPLSEIKPSPQRNYVEQSAEDRFRIAEENRRRSQQEATRALQEQLQLADQIGQTLGDAAYDFVSGMRSGNDVLRSLLNQLGRGLMQSAMSQATQGIVAGFN